MGKRILVRRRGRSGSVFLPPTHRRVAPAAYPAIDDERLQAGVRGVVEDFAHDPGRAAPLAMIRFENGKRFYVPAPEGLSLGKEITIASRAPSEIGNVMPLGSIPEGTLVCNIELKPGDGGRAARTSGAYGTVVSHTPAGTELKLPSGRSIYLSDSCLAMVGVVSGSGRPEKPFLKAGSKYHQARLRAEHWPHVRGQAMIAASHPFGGGRHKHPGKGTATARTAPPGRKVGLIAARRAGRKKR
ncbi:MAG: 50S ribosomal protein L2 [Candidatus Bathyarchaeia archaeon]